MSRAICEARPSIKNYAKIVQVFVVYTLLYNAASHPESSAQPMPNSHSLDPVNLAFPCSHV